MVVGGSGMKVAVLGMWHLGTVTAGCLAKAGYNVVGYDQNVDTVELLQKGSLPVNEPGLSELTASGLEKGLLSFTSDPGEISGCEIIWMAYDTPVDEQDRGDVDFVVSSIEDLFSHMKENSLVIISSQVPIGTTSRLENSFREKCPGSVISFACLPENLRLGKAIEVFNNPDRIVAGVRNEQDKSRISKLLGPFCSNIIWMSVESAEMTKHAINSFLATSVAFINELSGLCELYGADASEVEKGLKSDQRIGQQAYVRPGEAFAGGTLARDLKYLIRFGEEKNFPTPLFSGVIESNNQHKKWARRKLAEILKPFEGKKVAILGITYKPGTDTLRRSEYVETARWLSSKGVEVAAYDPAVKSLPDALNKVIRLCENPGEALGGADALLVGTPWPQFRELKAKEVASLMNLPAVIDPAGFLLETLKNRHGIAYTTIGGTA